MVQVGVESENGWRPAKVGAESLVWLTVPGTSVNLQIQKGWPAKVLAALAADFNAYIEPLRDRDSASYTPTNSVATSNHLNGTAMDLNWDSHPFHAKGTFNANQMRTIRELLDFYEGTIFWAGDWKSPIDEMHWQMGYGTWNNSNVGSFIARKIRSDGFSTFRRGVIEAKPKTDVAQLLSAAMGNSLSISRYTELLPAVQQALQKCNCTNEARIAMWLAQIGHESAGLRYMEEIADGSAYENRPDLGNSNFGDGRKFKGRGPIQITGRYNYTSLSQWAFQNKLVPTSNFFVDNPSQLSTDTYGFIGVIWYWTVARPGINSMCDNYDLNGVTRAINGGLNGIVDRKQRWNKCLSFRSELLKLIETPSATIDLEKGFLMALSKNEQIEIRDKVRQLWGASFNLVPSKSRYADPNDLWASKDFDRNMDGFIFDMIMEHDAALGDKAALERIQKAAASGDLIAHHFLEKLNAATTTVSYSPPTKSAEAIKTSNNVTCWKCGKHYPDILPNCPFCGSSQERPIEIPSPAASLESEPVTDPPARYLNPAESPSASGKHALPEGDLPSVNRNVVDQLSLLQRFNDQLPQEVSTAVDFLIPILKGLTK